MLKTVKDYEAPQMDLTQTGFSCPLCTSVNGTQLPDIDYDDSGITF